MTNKAKNSWVSILLLAIGLLLGILITSRSIQATRQMSDAYQWLSFADPAQDLRATVYYSDDLYAVLGFGIETSGADPAAKEQISSFLSSSMRLLDERILGAAVIYTMFVTVLLALFLYECFGQNALRHTAAVICTALIVCILLMAIPLYICASQGVPFYFPKGEALFVLLASVMSMIGGNCTLALLLRKIKFKKIAAVAAIPLVYFLFLFSSILEIGLFSPSQVTSFNYVRDVAGDAFADAYYDDEKNVLVVGEAEYPPELVPNSEHLTGIAYIGAAAYEVLVPYAGTGLSLIKQESDATIPSWVLLLYAVKAVFWIVIPAVFQKGTGKVKA